MTHEVFHCFEHSMVPHIFKYTGTNSFNVRGTAKNEADWILEGLARWVDLTLFPSTRLPGAIVNLQDFYSTPATPLFNRSYDAVGFWGHVQDVDGDLWQRIPGILKAGVGFQNQAAFNAAVGGNGEEILATYGSSGVNLPLAATGIWTDVSPLNADNPSCPCANAEPVAQATSVALGPYSTAQFKIASTSRPARPARPAGSDRLFTRRRLRPLRRRHQLWRRRADPYDVLHGHGRSMHLPGWRDEQRSSGDPSARSAVPRFRRWPGRWLCPDHLSVAAGILPVPGRERRRRRRSPSPRLRWRDVRFPAGRRVHTREVNEG